MTDLFVYKTVIPDGRFYIGCHQSKYIDISEDPYLGSGKQLVNYLKEHGNLGVTRHIIGYFHNGEEARRYERLQIMKYLRECPEKCLFTRRSLSGKTPIKSKATKTREIKEGLGTTIIIYDR